MSSLRVPRFMVLDNMEFEILLAAKTDDGANILMVRVVGGAEAVIVTSKGEANVYSLTRINPTRLEGYK